MGFILEGIIVIGIVMFLCKLFGDFVHGGRRKWPWE